ncbi:MAG TPA: acriflavin resistance protein [Firmicutes bacterium]|jgi:hydrophobic/amphiphilic exporter-1 (mainly G- bacteria), HAE1 family|nr:acriflavin resistance protein [Bacillota bacterium]
MTITELAIKRPILIVVIFSALTLLGIFGYIQLKYELFPNSNFPMVSITTNYTGASASEVETSVTKRVEDAVSGLDKVDTITSSSQEGRSRVQIQFTPDANIDFALQEAQRKVNGIIRNFPDGVDTPTLNKVSQDDRPVMSVGFTSNLPDTKFYQFVNDIIEPHISNMAGVGQVDIGGGRQREIKVNLDTHKMNSYGLSPLGILNSITKANLEYPAGIIKDTDAQYVIRLAGRFQSISEIQNLIIGQSTNGGDVRLSDVAEVQDSKKDLIAITRINGKDMISLRVLKQSDANTVEVTRLVREELKRLESQYQSINLKSQIVSDTSTFITDSANAVKEDLLLAILLVAGVMLLFLHSVRNSLIVMVAIPTSLVVTFIGMWAFGFSLNIITLLALSLVIGILVDDAIVVLENIYRHLEQGEKRKDAALHGRNEIGFTALSITMVDVVVYLPLTILSGTIGMVHQFAWAIIISTLTSLFVSFTVTPMLASRFSKLQTINDGTLMGDFGGWFEKKYTALTNDYLKVLNISLKNPGKVLLFALLLFGSALCLVFFGFIGTEFMPQADQNQFSVDFQLSPSAKIEQTNEMTFILERIVQRIPEVQTIYAQVGSSGGSSASNQGSLNVTLIPKDKRKRKADEITHALRPQLARIPGIRVNISQPNIMPGGGGYGAPIQVAINGPNWDDVMNSANQVQKLVAQIPGTSDVRLSAADPQPEMRIQIDRDKMAKLGLNMDTVGQTLQLGLTGNTSTQYEDRDGTQYDINVMLDLSNRMHTSDVGNLTVANQKGQLIPLNQFATITPSVGPALLQRRDRSYSVTVSSQAVGRTSGDIGNDIKDVLSRQKFPDGVRTTFIGTLKSQADSFFSLGLALLAALVFVYLIMAALYNSFIYPFVVLFAVPLALIGALLALALTKNSLAVFSIMGIIMQIGLVSKNAILLVDFTNKRREDGLSVKEALLEAGRERLRPILMTSLTMVFGMLPLALSKAPGSEFKNSMGWALIGGLICSMLMTLVVVPVVYTQIERLRGVFAERIVRLTGGDYSD